MHRTDTRIHIWKTSMVVKEMNAYPVHTFRFFSSSSSSSWFVHSYILPSDLFSFFWFGHVRAGAPSLICVPDESCHHLRFQLFAHKIHILHLEGVFDFQCAVGHSFSLMVCVFFSSSLCWTCFFGLPIIDHLCIWKDEARKEKKSEPFGFIKISNRSP